MATTDKQSKISKINSNWATCINPLRGLTKPQIEQMLQNARHGNDVRLQIAFKEIERTMPIFGICIEKKVNIGITIIISSFCQFLFSLQESLVLVFRRLL